METPKKPVKKGAAAKGAGVKKTEEQPDILAKKRIIDDDDDDDYDIPLDDLGRYENFEGYDEDDDY